MSDKGSGSKGSGGRASGLNQPGNSASTSKDSGTMHQPEIVSGWEYHMYEQRGYGRYAYIGKDESGTPEFVDWGKKSER